MIQECVRADRRPKTRSESKKQKNNQCLVLSWNPLKAAGTRVELAHRNHSQTASLSDLDPGSQHGNIILSCSLAQ